MPEHTDATRFLQAVFGDDYETAAILANLNPAVHVRTLDGLDDRRDCYWCVAAFAGGHVTRTKDMALEVRALVIDDVGTKVPEVAVEMALGGPTAITLTSAGNTQWAYRLDAPVLEADWKAFFAEIERRVGQKLEGRDAVHIFRLPMGVNTKPGRGMFQVQLVELNPEVKLKTGGIITTNTKSVAVGSVPGPGPSGGSDIRLGLEDLRTFMGWIPSKLFPHRDQWIVAGHDIKALCENDEDGFTVFDEWSEPEKSAGYNRAAWEELGASGLRSTGGMLKGAAQAANPDGYAKMFAPKVFDDGVDLIASPAGGGVDFFVDQEKSSIAVVKHLGGRLKCVGRDDWREFDPGTGRWREWTGNHMMRVVLEMVAERKLRALDPEVSKKLGSVKFIEGIARAAALHRDVIARVTDFDRGALLLGVPSGVIDLRKGASRAVRVGRAPEMVSKSMWVDPAPPGTSHPEWSRFLSEFTQGDAALEEWLQVRAGYCLTGLMDEYIMPFYHGSGGNGKSVYLNALRSVWGEYGAQMEHRLLFEKSGGYHLAPLAVLSGVRLAIVTDVPQGASWDVHIMKMLTGDDAITANRMHQNPITFKSTAKVDVSGNGEPTVKDMDEGVRRRLKLIPLTAKPKTIDKQLSRKLAAEWGAILGWALTGLDMYWGLGGFPAAKVVDDATREYHAMLDPFQRWVDECVVKDGSKGAKVSTTDLYRSWDTFRSAEGRHGIAPQNANAVARKMKDKGFVFNASGGYNYLWGYKTNSVSVF